MSSRKPASTVKTSVTVKDATFNLLRAFGIKKVFGNPGSTELPFLARLARRYRLRAGPAGSLRDRHGRRLCAGHPQCRFRQSAFGRRRRQCARQHLHRAPQPDAAGDHRGPAGAQHPAAAGRSSMPSAPRNFRGPMSNSASSRRAPRTCRRRSRAPITWRCSRPAGRPSSRCRSTTGPIQPSRSRRAASAANSAPIRTRCRRWPRRSPQASALPSWSAPASIAGAFGRAEGKVAEKAKAAVWVSPFSSRCSFFRSGIRSSQVSCMPHRGNCPTRCASMTWWSWSARRCSRSTSRATRRSSTAPRRSSRSPTIRPPRR